ncbi:TetR family transcriptional regulator [Bifidobacterium sp. SMB2]|uniref:TetR family transcriptional regulator n=1 Tax=Bifidobacterium saimiriisciurei TaxID=2661627 RepID=A0ABX0CBA7_9BIFI|nr:MULTISPECIES: TetR family transcriptional regulator [Bifidobacterium]NEG96599.1 TetR family transcriptional regulator [Bifidobacterium sp. SMB2]NEH12382.1 TetR family transcriptional regulator [Bifidobacterium saimiriisciurei]
MASSQSRRNDPERKQRIIDACLDVIAERGVAGTSHRVVAAKADVPLGSMTYYFDGMDDLLHQAFSQFVQRSIDVFAARMADVSGTEEACEAVARHIEGDLLTTSRDFTINLEFYTIAARNVAFRDLSEQWMAASRAELERFFDTDTARLLDALVEGLTLHRAFGNPASPAAIRTAIRRITGR